MDRYFWRQILILFSLSMYTMNTSLVVAFPGVMNPSLLAPNGTDITVTRSQASWIAASNAIGGVPYFILLPLIMQHFGRKAVSFIAHIVLSVGWIMIVFSKNTTTLYFARIIQGVSIGTAVVSCVIASEYCHPKRRGYFIAIKKISIGVAVLLFHITSLYLSWRQIAGTCMTLNCLGFLTTLLWPESPAFLAMKGRFEECRKSFTWLFGNSVEAQNELSELIAAQDAKLKGKSRGRNSPRKYLRIFFAKDFQLALSISILITILMESIGRHVIMTYVVQIMMELVKDRSIATYFSIGADCLIILAFSIAGFIIKIINRRTLLFTFGAVSVLLMGVISLVIFLKSKSILSVNSWMVITTILVFVFVSHVGVLPAIYSIYGEIFSLEHRGLGVSISGICFACIYGTSLKLSPFLIEKSGLHGLFMVYGLCSLLCLIALYLVLPETKDKTLLHIEFEMKGLKKMSPEVKPMLS